MKQHITEFVKNCDVCQKNKFENVPYTGLLQPLPLTGMAWSMDFFEGLPKSQNQDVILFVADILSKYVHFISLSHPYTAAEVVQFGLPKVILTETQFSQVQFGNQYSRLWVCNST
jgi:hypothetical protein